MPFLTSIQDRRLELKTRGDASSCSISLTKSLRGVYQLKHQTPNTLTCFLLQLQLSWSHLPQLFVNTGSKIHLPIARCRQLDWFLDTPVCHVSQSLLESVQLIYDLLVDTPGLTYLTYTPNGRHLLTVGSNNVARKFTVGSDDEPVNIDQSQDANTGIAASVRPPL